MPKMNLTCKANGVGRFLLAGEISHQSVLNVIDMNVVSSEANVSVDFSAVTRSDSAGLALMVHWSRQAKDANTTIRYECVPEKLLALAKMSGLDLILPIFSETSPNPS